MSNEQSTASAWRQPPVDTTTANPDQCLACGSPKVFLDGHAKAARCVKCGLIAWHHPVPLVIAGADLISEIKFFAELWQELREIYELRDLADDQDFAPLPGDPTFAELYESKVAEVAGHIGEIRIEGDT